MTRWCTHLWRNWYCAFVTRLEMIAVTFATTLFKDSETEDVSVDALLNVPECM